ncbi:DinB family protein [Angustibacter aerolatus]
MTAQFGPHRWSPSPHTAAHTDAYRGAEVAVRDLRGARVVDSDLTGARIVDSTLVDVELSGYVERLRVNGIDVTAYVEAELDRLHPERVQLRGVQDADGFRAAWQTVERLWADDVARAERLPEAARSERVAGEWSFAETLQHLVFITDSWVSRTVLDEERPFHPLALPQTAYAPGDAAALGMQLAADPTWDEVLEARAGRQQVVRDVLADLTDRDLGRECLRTPAPGYPDGGRPVWECLSVLLEEEIEHRRYAVRDLAVLEARLTA